ncbi:unnamed protein product [Caenorhabditis auriculariae]|uniref:NOT2/NOT3/NOT5 C-terminal domain-containing protein n=1 Tax=Caenorhabditis auriculariae TaxID=2777116 RepID=A0A8S1H4D4_9PELO|nr:unnamed protein product [Caenorhabditis auriculariae]
MSSVGGVATDTRFTSQHFTSPLKTTIINESEFPSLGARSTPLGGGYSPLPTTSGAAFTAAQSSSPFKDAFLPNHRNYATLMRSDPSLTNPEFQIQNEDFPALPGAGAPGSGSAAGIDLGSHPTQSLLTSAADSFASATSMDPYAVRAAGNEPVRGIITHPDGEVSNIPASMLADQFGMAGLVTYLRTVDNPSIVSLALGYDLTTLGLNLNISDCRRQLYATFGGPWADNPIRPHELDVKVPDEYLTNALIRDKLPPVKLNKLSEDVLFYLFYNCPNEVYQIAAACELYQRDWRYHKTEGVWLTRSQYGGVKEQTGTYEKGQYNVFDQMQWRKIPKELKLEYKELEERPKLPQISSGGRGGDVAPGAGLGSRARQRPDRDNSPLDLIDHHEQHRKPSERRCDARHRDDRLQLGGQRSQRASGGRRRCHHGRGTPSHSLGAIVISIVYECVRSKRRPRLLPQCSVKRKIVARKEAIFD